MFCSFADKFDMNVLEHTKGEHLIHVPQTFKNDVYFKCCIFQSSVNYTTEAKMAKGRAAASLLYVSVMRSLFE